MGLFDSIVAGATQRAGLGSDQAGGLLAALLGLITDPKGGGFGGFIDKFRTAGLGDVVNSWISTGANTSLSNEQVVSALGSDTIDSISRQSGVDRTAATGALRAMIPSVVDTLTPDGTVPDEQTLLSKIGGFLSGWGGAVGFAVARRRQRSPAAATVLGQSQHSAGLLEQSIRTAIESDAVGATTRRLDNKCCCPAS